MISHNIGTKSENCHQKMYRSLSRLSRKPYWPPENTSTVIDFPGGRKKMFVFNGKSDRDGSEQPVLCISTVGGKRLAFFDEEEVDELLRVSARLQDYMILWEKKAGDTCVRVSESERRKIASQDSIGVEI